MRYCDVDTPGLTARVETLVFDAPGGNGVSEVIRVYDTPEHLADALRAVPDAQQCSADAVNRGVLDTEDLTFSGATVADMPAPSIGDASTHYRVTIHVKSNQLSGAGSEGDITLDDVIVLVGRFGFQVRASSSDGPPPAELLDTYVSRAVANVRAVLDGGTPTSPERTATPGKERAWAASGN